MQKNHLGSASDNCAKLNAGILNKQPGLRRPVRQSTITPKVVQVQPEGPSHWPEPQHAIDDFVSAFLLAISVDKLNHPSMWDLFKKRTPVEGCVGNGATHYRTSSWVYIVQHPQNCVELQAVNDVKNHVKSHSITFHPGQPNHAFMKTLTLVNGPFERRTPSPTPLPRIFHQNRARIAFFCRVSWFYSGMGWTHNIFVFIGPEVSQSDS